MSSIHLKTSTFHTSSHPSFRLPETRSIQEKFLIKAEEIDQRSGPMKKLLKDIRNSSKKNPGLLAEV